MLSYKPSSARDGNLLEQVLRQGEALRAAMVNTILKNEPFYNESDSKIKQSEVENLNTNKTELSLHDKHACLAYMNGDPMSKLEEQEALNTFRSLSSTDICDLTSRSFTTTQNSCKCQTCLAYVKLNFSLYHGTINTDKVPPLRLKQNKTKQNGGNNDKVMFSQERIKQKHDNFEVFQYVDSLKVVLHSFIITNEGKIKVASSQNHQKLVKFEDLNCMYYIEYEIPIGIKKCYKKISKVDSGLTSVNVIKKCSKNLINNVVYFKQTIVHDIENLDIINLEDINVVFKITAKSLRHKSVQVLGFAKFNFVEFYSTPSLSCLHEIPVFLNEDSPIVTGSIRIQVQLGCEKLYFGKEFIDSLQNKEKQVKVDLTSDERLDETFILSNDDLTLKRKDFEKTLSKKSTTKECDTRKQKYSSNVVSKEKLITSNDNTNQKLTKPESNLKKSDVKNKNFDSSVGCDVHNLNVQQTNEKIILFGFVFISHVEYQQHYAQTYFTCQPFCQQDYICSNVTRGGAAGDLSTFNYHQVIPYVYDDDFLFNLRENHMIIEFFTSESSTYDEVIGICKVPLHQYYLAFRNPVIVKYLTRNHLPVIGTDWYEPIKDVASGSTVGNAQILVALGSEEQIKNLQKERGFMDDSVKRKKSELQTKKINADKYTPNKNKVTRKKVVTSTVNKELDKNVQTENTVDKSTSTSNSVTFATPTLIEKSDNMADNKIVDDRLQTIQDYLQKLVEMKTQNTRMDSDNDKSLSRTSLNNVNVGQNGGETTQNPVVNVPTANLLETLQGVINFDSKPTAHAHNFKAQIIVESALHLPARKKCRARKVKGKVIREELLPSTYVSYEIKDGVVKTSHVVQKNTSPVWGLKNDVSVPIDYLTNSNRRLLFKVWRKSNNGSTIPNMQIDTIIGFATVDLTVLLAGLPTIEGWFNIMDFTNKCNGQIKVNVIPLEDITKFNKLPTTTSTSYTTTPTDPSSATTMPSPTIPTDVCTSPDETFSRALKRKFIELEEISQRLKSRLNHVTDDLPPEDDQELNDTSADEFENDINTLCVEDDYDLLDFAKEAQDMNMRRVSTSLHQWQLNSNANPNTQELMITTDNDQNFNDEKSSERSPSLQNQELALQKVGEDLKVKETETNLKTFIPEGMLLATKENSNLTSNSMVSNSSSCSSSTLDRQLNEGKERIDHLLQRLTLLSTNQLKPGAEGGFGDRYVSGCSTSVDPVPSSTATFGNLNLEEDILSELGIEKDFDARKLFNAASLESFNGNLETLLGRSFRDAPDGEGNTTESSTSDDKLN